MVNPLYFATLKEAEFSLGKKIKAVVTPAYMMEAALKSYSAKSKEGLKGKDLSDLTEFNKTDKTTTLKKLLQYLVKTNANDVLITAGAPPSIKISSTLKRLAIADLTPADCEAYAKELLTKNGWKKFSTNKNYEIGITYPETGRFRVNLFRQRNTISIALRPVVEKIPGIEELNLPDWITNFVLRPQGLILVSGPAGHGKSTTMAVLVDIINTRRGCNIITLEDPIEYLHKHKKSNINQREVRSDIDSFADGLRNVFRQAPDIIVIGEMRDKETFSIALQAANSGHLVLSTIHSDNSTSIIERIINMFETHEQNLIRLMMAESLMLSLSQRLIPLKNGQGRILALENFINSRRMKNLIREGKTHQIRSQMQIGADDFTSIDIALADLYKKGLIKIEDGLTYSDDEFFFRELIGTNSKK